MVGDWFTESLALVNVLVVGAGLGRGEERKEGCGTDRLYQNVGVNYQYTLRNVPGERRSQIKFVTWQFHRVGLSPCILCLYSGLKLYDSQSVGFRYCNSDWPRTESVYFQPSLVYSK